MTEHEPLDVPGDTYAIDRKAVAFPLASLQLKDDKLQGPPLKRALWDQGSNQEG